MSTSVPETPHQDAHWKEKYRSAVSEFDALEGNWRETESQLEKTILRLSSTYVGHNVDLDRKIKSLPALLKKNAEASTRLALVDEIVEHVLEIKSQGKDERSKVGDVSIFSNFVEKLKVPSPQHDELKLIASKLSPDDEYALDQHVSRFAELINELTANPKTQDCEPDKDIFTEFLSKLASRGSIGDKASNLQKRSTEIRTDLERLAIIDETIALLNQEISQERPSEPGSDKARAILRELIEWMTLPTQVEQQIKVIQSQLEGAMSSAQLSKTLRELGHAVSHFHSALISELTDVEFYLKSTAVRLKELQLGIEESFSGQRQSFGDQVDLNSGIEAQVNRLATQLEGEDDLDAIKHVIDAGFQVIRSRMHEHNSRDRQRMDDAEQRFDTLRERLSVMSDESNRLRDQVEQERKHARLDALTGVPNRAAFDERISAEFARHQRHHRKLSLAVIDIDNFKDVNDAFGHKAGDKVLRNIAQICANNVRNGDLFARYGGEEFALVLPETALDQAHIVAEKLREEIAGKRFVFNNQRVPITVSIGIAEVKERETEENTFSRADQALYMAKQRGRNCCITELLVVQKPLTKIGIRFG
ncbi:MAG: diguanylate cyclase [Gammaproteobacteria bacterium]|jgi:diguanylate cyclase